MIKSAFTPAHPAMAWRESRWLALAELSAVVIVFLIHRKLP